MLLVGPVDRGADLGAQAAPGAVVRGDLDGDPQTGEVLLLRGAGLEGGGGVGEQRRVERGHPDRGVRADQRALAAVDAQVRVPDGQFVGDAALLVAGGADGEGAIDRQGADRQQFALAGHDAGGDLLDEHRGVRGEDPDGGDAAEATSGEGDLGERAEGGVDGGVVTGQHLLAAFALGDADRVLDGGDSDLGAAGVGRGGQQPGQAQVAGLQDGADDAGQARVA